MCTLTIYSTQEKKIITMSRDEQRSRHETSEILYKTSNQTHYYHPVDKLSGGTWFGFNNHGYVMALLNRYQDKNIKANISRGIIIPHLLELQSHAQILDSLYKLKLSNFQPFDLVISGLSISNRFSWNGNQLKQIKLSQDNPFILSSSSVDSEYILKHRSKLFNDFNNSQTNITPNSILKDFHLTQDKNDTSSSIYMSREMTHTKSISQVTFNSNDLQYKYFNEQSLNNSKPVCQKTTLNLSC